MWNSTSGCWPSWRGWEQVCQFLHEPSWWNVIFTRFGSVPPHLFLVFASFVFNFTVHIVALIKWLYAEPFPRDACLRFLLFHSRLSLHHTGCSCSFPSVLQPRSLLREPFSSLSMCSRMCLPPLTIPAPPVGTQPRSHFHAWAGTGGGGSVLPSSALPEAVTLCLFVLRSKYVTFLIHSSIWNIPAGVWNQFFLWYSGAKECAWLPGKVGQRKGPARQETAMLSFGLCNRDMVLVAGISADPPLNGFPSEMTAINSGFHGFPRCSLLREQVEIFEELQE